MQLRTSTEAIDYVNIRQGFRGNDESTNQRLRPCIRENKNAKIAKIRVPRKFNPAKVKAYTVSCGEVQILMAVHYSFGLQIKV